jgi:hypothetical protein
MDLYLEDGRTYVSSDKPSAVAVALEKQGKHVYMFLAKGSFHTTFNIEQIGKRQQYNLNIAAYLKC